ncbi:hypothetical protein HAPAU_12020 [Halalkalicoccus paucihalophilus]|uniref:DUF7344 domain-containing protein n=1 Tax=Halalkalicoccus paucihalophilus TaxID=1008153 RepID=A0A151AEW5_9EURY|nr:hypothetical protein [Halalkalicoccus paucihalophilus]KYH26110.1 hypothetical protein HAPAU_12020 [Halalkalicoccus paucihalophilus]
MGTKTGSSTPAATEEAPSDLDIALRTLAKPQRRFVLERMCEHGGPIDATDLAAAIAAADSDGAAIEDSDRVLRSLRHIHLPKLTDAGLIEYDRVNETATPTEMGTQVLTSLAESLR